MDFNREREQEPRMGKCSGTGNTRRARNRELCKCRPVSTGGVAVRVSRGGGVCRDGPGSRWSRRGEEIQRKTQRAGGQAKEQSEYVTFGLQEDQRSWVEQDQHCWEARQDMNLKKMGTENNLINETGEHEHRTLGGRVTTNGSRMNWRRVAGSTGLRTLQMMAWGLETGEMLETPLQGIDSCNSPHNQTLPRHMTVNTPSPRVASRRPSELGAAKTWTTK